MKRITMNTEEREVHVQDQMGKYNDLWVARVNDLIHQGIGENFFFNDATHNSISIAVVGCLTDMDVWELIRLIQEAKELRTLIHRTKIPYGTSVMINSSSNRIMSDEAKRYATLCNTGVFELQIEFRV